MLLLSICSSNTSDKLGGFQVAFRFQCFSLFLLFHHCRCCCWCYAIFYLLFLLLCLNFDTPGASGLIALFSSSGSSHPRARRVTAAAPPEAGTISDALHHRASGQASWPGHPKPSYLPTPLRRRNTRSVTLLGRPSHGLVSTEHSSSVVYPIWSASIHQLLQAGHRVALRLGHLNRRDPPDWSLSARSGRHNGSDGDGDIHLTFTENPHPHFRPAERCSAPQNVLRWP